MKRTIASPVLQASRPGRVPKGVKAKVALTMMATKNQEPGIGQQEQLQTMRGREILQRSEEQVPLAPQAPPIPKILTQPATPVKLLLD